MSLLVFSNGALYSDRCYIIGEGTAVQKKAKGDKLYFNTGKTAAVALVGEDPGFDTDDFQLIIDYVCGRMESAAGGEEINLKDEKLLRRMFANGETSYLVMNKKMACIMTSKNVIRLPESEDFAIGTGDLCFQVCRQSGLSIEDAYRHAAKIVFTMDAEVRKISRSELFDIKNVSFDDVVKMATSRATGRATSIRKRKKTS